MAQTSFRIAPATSCICIVVVGITLALQGCKPRDSCEPKGKISLTDCLKDLNVTASTCDEVNTGYARCHNEWETNECPCCMPIVGPGVDYIDLGQDSYLFSRSMKLAYQKLAEECLSNFTSRSNLTTDICMQAHEHCKGLADEAVGAKGKYSGCPFGWFDDVFGRLGCKSINEMLHDAAEDCHKNATSKKNMTKDDCLWARWECSKLARSIAPCEYAECPETLFSDWYTTAGSKCTGGD